MIMVIVQKPKLRPERIRAQFQLGSVNRFPSTGRSESRNASIRGFSKTVLTQCGRISLYSMSQAPTSTSRAPHMKFPIRWQAVLAAVTGFWSGRVGCARIGAPIGS